MNPIVGVSLPSAGGTEAVPSVRTACANKSSDVMNFLLPGPVETVCVTRAGLP